MKCVSSCICVYHLGLFVFFLGVSPSSRVTGACPVTTDLMMRVTVRTAATTVVDLPPMIVRVPSRQHIKVGKAPRLTGTQPKSS